MKWWMAWVNVLGRSKHGTTTQPRPEVVGSKTAEGLGPVWQYDEILVEPQGDVDSLGLARGIDDPELVFLDVPRSNGPYFRKIKDGERPPCWSGMTEWADKTGSDRVVNFSGCRVQ
jgi:hypothetical protein